MPVAAILGGAAIGAIGSAIAGNDAKSAADTAANTQLQMYNQTRTDLLPFQTTGASALSQLAAIYGLGPGGSGSPSATAAMSQLTQFPGYQFGLQQGQTALDTSAASRGLLLSGSQLQASQQFGTNYALQQAWNPYVSGLQSLSTLGENAAAGTGSAGTAAASGAAQSQLAAGSASGNATANITNTLQSALQQYALTNPSGSSGYVPGDSVATPSYAMPTVSSLAGGW